MVRQAAVVHTSPNSMEHFWVFFLQRGDESGSSKNGIALKQTQSNRANAAEREAAFKIIYIYATGLYTL